MFVPRLIDSPPPARGPRGACRGIGLIEVLVGLVILTVAVLGHLSGVTAAQKHAKATEERALAVLTLQRLVERLRADTDWMGLWNRLRVYSRESTTDAGLTHLGVDLTLQTYPYYYYYSDLNVPAVLRNATFLVQIPWRWDATLGQYQLREDAVAPRYGLPWDLDGDGVVDAASHHADYRQLPVVVRIRWQPKGQSAQEVVVSTWLRGDR
jgi:hypothetical protein